MRKLFGFFGYSIVGLGFKGLWISLVLFFIKNGVSYFCGILISE